METLVDIKQDKKETFTSLELVEQINIFRKEEKGDTFKPLVHKNLLAIIRDEFSEEISELKIQPSDYMSERGRKFTMFELPLDQCKQVLMRESKYVRKAMINYINKLEKELQNKFTIPQTFSQALLLASQQAKLIELQESKIKEDAPKVEFANAIERSENSILIGQFAKMDGRLGQNKLFKILRDKKVLMNQGPRKNEPYQKYLNQGVFELTESTYEAKGNTYNARTTLLTGKGQTWLKAWLDRNI